MKIILIWMLLQLTKEIDMKKMLAVLAMVLMFTGTAFAADVQLKWDASADATGYIVYKSLDNGATWDAGIDVGNVTEYICTGVEEDCLVLFRVGAYNTSGEGISYWSGAWYNKLWMPPLSAQGLGVGQVSL